MKTIRIGLLGLGTIGSGLFRLIQENGDLLRAREGVDFQIVRVLVRTPSKLRGIELSPELLTTDPAQVISSPDIDLVVEMMGGAEPARSYLLEALGNGKSVVTANKEVVATHFDELQTAARSHGTGIHFEASVAGGIPILRAIRQSLQGNRILRIMGVINGTTNYILTRMSEEGRGFGEVLAEAKRLGYAEPDPTYDIEGIDARFKLAILATLGFGRTVRIEDIHCEGITNITAEDILFGRQLGYAIKLLAIARDTGNGLDVRVHPTFLPVTHPLAAVRDANNAIFVDGNAVGELMFYGRGAGDMPTASALVSDMVMAVREDGCCRCEVELSATLPSDAYQTGLRAIPVSGTAALSVTHQEGMETVDAAVVQDWETECYIRMTVADHPGVLASVAGIFGRHGVSIESVIQKARSEDTVPLIFVTHRAGEHAMRAAVDEIRKLGMVHAIDSIIRVER